MREDELATRNRQLEDEIMELKSREKVLRKLVSAVEHSPISIFITDRTGSIEYVNRKFCQVTGYTPEEVIGSNPSFLKGDSLPEEVFRNMWEIILSGREWHGEFHNRNKDGTMIWELASISSVCNEAGVITHFVVVKEDISELKRLQKKLGEMAHSDDLTGLPNRALLMDRLEQLIIHAHRHLSRFGLLFMDLDGFKAVNDSYGHQTGDKLLQAVAQRLTTCVRDSDTVARIGGDEFVVIVEDLKHIEVPGIVARQMLEAFTLPFIIDETVCKVGLSIGVSMYPDDAEDAETLISCADAAMYQVKQTGKHDFRYSGRR